MSNFQPYHLVDLSPWPLTGAMGAMVVLCGFVFMFYYSDLYLVIMGIFILIVTSILWWRDISHEGGVQGFHSLSVVMGLSVGMILFILSEVLFFVSFFWTFFHSSLSPTFYLGGCWPPEGIISFNPFHVPLLNTAVLLSSGVSVTWCHYGILKSNYNQALSGLAITLMLGVYFTFLQLFEYYEAGFSISDSVYGSTFFVATGFHGLHVIIGSTFLLVCLIRMVLFNFSSYHHFGFEAAVWYWHFVDVVWLFLFVSIYWWGY